MTAAPDLASPDHTPIRTLADVEAIEAVPLEARIHTWDASAWLWEGLQREEHRTAISYIENGDADAEAVVVKFAQLRRRAVQMANLLHRIGVGPGDGVVSLLPNIPAVYTLATGALARGIACPLNWMLSKEVLRELIEAVRPKVVVALGPTPGFDIWEKALHVRQRSGLGFRLISVQGLSASAPAADDLDRMLDGEPDTHLAFESKTGPDAIAAYIHSGGTTGSPKLVQLTHRGFVYKLWHLRQLLGYGSQETIFADYPFFHSAGYINRAVAPVALGMSVVIPSAMGARDKAFVSNYWRFVERFGVTQLSGVPATLSLLAKNPPRGERISTLKPFATTGSQPLPASVAEAIERQTGVRMLLTYGSTEFTTTLTQSPYLGTPRYGSPGLRLPYTRVRIVEIDDACRIVRECRPGEIGMVVAKGPGITPGYLVERNNERLFTPDGWIVSGDLGRLDDDGYIWLVGRSKDLIIRGGHNIEPSRIEDALLQHPAVLHAAAVGKPDSYAGELPVAYVQLVEGATCTPDELKAFAAGRISERAAVPTEIFLVDEIPLSDVRKPLKAVLKRDAARRTFLGLLANATAPQVALDVDVRTEPEVGDVAVITLQGSERGQAEADISEIMKQFALNYRIERMG